jgi:transposase
VLEPWAREVMRELTIAVGRPMVHDLRAMCDAVAYVVKNGVEWRALPVDFPPWKAAYAFFERWNGRGLPQALVTRLRELLRQHQGRGAQPTACVIDSQMVKAHDTVSRKTSGYHGGKKITGRGRHVAVDTEGWLLALVVTAASVSDKAGAKTLLIQLFDAFSTLKLMWADTGYNRKPLSRYAHAVAAITVEVVARTSPHSFQVLRHRWVVERTFGWLMRYRRLARDYERTTANSEAMIYWATVIIMTRRLARYENGQPPIKRWGGERPRPTEQTALSTGLVTTPKLGPGIKMSTMANARNSPYRDKDMSLSLRCEGDDDGDQVAGSGEDHGQPQVRQVRACRTGLQRGAAEQGDAESGRAASSAGCGPGSAAGAAAARRRSSAAAARTTMSRTNSVYPVVVCPSP